MNLFGYFDLGRRAMDAARLGLQVAGDNISNASTPGYARRRLDLVPGPVIQVPGGWLDQGVEVGAIRRMEDRFLQANLEREKGGLGEADERLRGLKEIEAIFGSLDGNGIASALAGFTASFNALAGQADSLGARRAALSAADTLAGALRDTSARLQTQRGLLDKSVEGSVAEINRLAGELAGLNREIALEEADGTVAAPLRDRRAQVIESLGDLTGGAAYAGPGGRLLFALPSGVTLVSGDNALPLGTARAANGTLRILSGADGTDITDRQRGGRLGARLGLRDDTIPASLGELDSLAADLTTRANALTTAATDLQGNAGTALFVPDPPAASGAAGSIAVNAALLSDPTLLAVSTSGAPGEGSAAAALAALPDQASVALGGKSAAAFLADGLARIGNSVARADVDQGVAQGVVDGLTERRDAVSGVSLDEEGLEVMRNQKAFEAAARFMQVMDSVTSTAVAMFKS